MIKLTLIALVAVCILVTPALASCPNACSGHGTCGDYDSCTCHHNWQGGDCSQRVCMYNWAWATTQQGDLNFDGDLLDATIYSDGYYYSSGASYLETDQARGGTWEWWPTTHSQTTDEGHFYMECSNRGLCDRKTGECNCFDGFTGDACRRNTCPDDCNGNGLCLTVNEQLALDNAATGNSVTYALWDGDMSRTCKCDAGFFGPSCADKKCPMGDDPLTKDHQVDETQWVEIKSTCNSCAGTLGGTSKFSYTDAEGKTWETDPIDIIAYDGSTTADQMATDLEAALKAIPNDVFPDVTVSAGFCETVLPGKFIDFSTASATDQYNAGTDPTTGYMRCPDAMAGSVKMGHLVVDLADSLNVKVNWDTGASDATVDSTAIGSAASGQDNGEQSCHAIANDQCVRFTITMTGNPGALELVSADYSSVTRNSATNDEDSAMLITSTSTKTLLLVDDSTATFDYAGANIYEESSDDAGTITPATKTITFGTQTTGATFPINSVIELFCTPTGGSLRSLGKYTTTATTTSGADIVVSEAIVADNAPCANANDGTVKVVLQSHIVTTNVDLLNAGIAGLVPLVSTESETAETVVDFVQYPAAATGHIFLSGTSAYTTTFTSTGTLTLNGAGTKENVECGDRGLCDRESGLCKCFKGYTGDACGIQSALVA